MARNLLLWYIFCLAVLTMLSNVSLDQNNICVHHGGHSSYQVLMNGPPPTFSLPCRTPCTAITQKLIGNIIWNLALCSSRDCLGINDYGKLCPIQNFFWKASNAKDKLIQPQQLRWSPEGWCVTLSFVVSTPADGGTLNRQKFLASAILPKSVSFVKSRSCSLIYLLG